MQCLLIAFAFVLPYHVLRTATAAGHRVHVLGAGASQGLKWSRYCASYTETGGDPQGDADELILDDIRRVTRHRGIDIVLPSDDLSTRLVATLRPRLPVPTSLIPDLATFDLLNDKWNFTRFCLDNGIRVPEGRLYRDPASLRSALATGALKLPVTVKPTCRSGGSGVFHLREAADLPLLDAVDYRPILAQRHIEGETIGFNVVCRSGTILGHATQRRDERRFELFADDDLRRNVERLVARISFDGPANFDAVVQRGTGLAYLVECNPRFWYTIYMSMILGLNFLELAVGNCDRSSVPHRELRHSVIEILKNLRRATIFDWKMVAYRLSDPVPYLLERWRAYDDSEVHLHPEQMTSYDPPSLLLERAPGLAELGGDGGGGLHR